MEYQITKILIISFFSSILISLFLNTKYIIFFKKFTKTKKILLNLFIYSFSSLTLILINYCSIFFPTPDPFYLTEPI